MGGVCFRNKFPPSLYRHPGVDRPTSAIPMLKTGPGRTFLQCDPLTTQG